MSLKTINQTKQITLPAWDEFKQSSGKLSSDQVRVDWDEMAADYQPDVASHIAWAKKQTTAELGNELDAINDRINQAIAEYKKTGSQTANNMALKYIGVFYDINAIYEAKIKQEASWLKDSLVQ